MAERAGRRPLRVFAFDPMVDRFRAPVLLQVPFEHLRPGLEGRLVRVVDVDLDRGRTLPVVDLDDPQVLLGSGLTPSESDFRSHQQGVYAIAMVVLEAFERGLGRPLVWHAGRPLTLVPHASEMQNAYIDPETFSLLFGRFPATRSAGANLPGQTVYTCLGWDIVAHETCHPVMIDLRPMEVGPDQEQPASPDTFALHEGLSDLIACLVRLAEPEIVRPYIAEHGIDLSKTPLLTIGSQFGQAAGLGRVLRSFPGPGERPKSEEPHERGQSLTSAVVVAVLSTQAEQCRDLFGLHGAPRADGRWHPDLVGRLVEAVTTISREALDVSIGALDLLPPFDARFGDYLRAMVTVSTERFGARHEAFRGHLITAFHERGMVPSDVDSLAPDAVALVPFERSISTPLPCVDRALLLTQHAIELRRAFMTEPGSIDKAAEVVRTAVDERARCERAIESFVRKQRGALGVPDGDLIRVRNLTGSFTTDTATGVRARVLVQVEHRPRGRRRTGEPSRRKGFTLIANSTGEIRYVVPTSAARRSRQPKRWPWRNATNGNPLGQAAS